MICVRVAEHLPLLLCFHRFHMNSDLCQSHGLATGVTTVLISAKSIPRNNCMNFQVLLVDEPQGYLEISPGNLRNLRTCPLEWDRQLEKQKTPLYVNRSISINPLCLFSIRLLYIYNKRCCPSGTQRLSHYCPIQ
jgi:hypothetical protein